MELLEAFIIFIIAVVISSIIHNRFPKNPYCFYTNRVRCGHLHLTYPHSF